VTKSGHLRSEVVERHRATCTRYGERRVDAAGDDALLLTVEHLECRVPEPELTEPAGGPTKVILNPVAVATRADLEPLELIVSPGHHLLRASVRRRGPQPVRITESNARDARVAEVAYLHDVITECEQPRYGKHVGAAQL